MLGHSWPSNTVVCDQSLMPSRVAPGQLSGQELRHIVQKIPLGLSLRMKKWWKKSCIQCLEVERNGRSVYNI